MSDVTQLLRAVEAGDPNASDQLLARVYDELRELAAARMAFENPGQTLQPTALVHEAWLRLGGDEQPNWQNRAHFFASAAEAMRRILIDRARKRLTVRRGGGVLHASIDDFELPCESSDNDDQVLALNEALERFAQIEPRKAELVKLRYFVGFSFDDAAAALDIAVPTAKQWWAYARAWLTIEMRKELRLS